MGIPILTSEGFAGQRWIIDDYFRAGETLHAGDVVVIRQRKTDPFEPRVFKATDTQQSGVTEKHHRRVIGIVHTPANKEVGDEVATTGLTVDEDEYVPIVVKGIAKTLCTTAIGVGDPVMASGTTAVPTGKTASVSTVTEATTHNHSPGDDDMTGEAGEHIHVVSLVTQN